MSNKLLVLKHYLKFKYRKFKSRKQLEKFQMSQINKHLEFVTENSLFYHDYAGKKLEDFPVIDKKIMMDNFNILNTVGIDRDEALEFAVNSERTRKFNPKLNNITVGLSSGTSHSRGIFLVENSEKNKWAGYVLAKFLPEGILSSYKVAFFMRANSNLYESVNSKNIQFHFFDIYSDINENLENLNKLNPDILVGQPSVLLVIAGKMKSNAINIKPRVVISIAEVLEKEDESYIKSAFGVDVIHQVYQCTEGCLATTCKHGTLHLNEDIVHIEKEYLDDKRFVPIITDFERTSQPIIRYRLNDVLVEKQEPCKCGSLFTAIEKIEGREDDVFTFKTNSGEDVMIFPDFIRRCILFSGNITDYRIVQNEDNSITVFADIDDNMKQKVSDEFKKLADDKNSIMPKIEFKAYCYDKNRKLKRVEHKR